MTDLAQLAIEIDSRPVEKATRNLDQFEDQARRSESATERLRRETDQAMRAADRMASVYQRVSGVLRTVAGALGLGFGLREFMTATAEREAGIAQLEAAIASTGGAAGMTSEELQALAGSLQNVTRFGDDTIIAAEGILLTFLKIGRDVFPQATEAALDLATRMGGDLSGAAVLIGKALNDPIQGLTALGRQGVQFSESQKGLIQRFVETNRVAEAQAVILEELGRQFGGSARAARNTFGGALDGLKNAFGDLFEFTGEGSARVRNAIETLVKTLQNESFVSAFQSIGTAVFGALNVAAGAVQVLADNLNIVIPLLAVLAARFVVGTVMGWAASIGRAAAMTAVYDVATRSLNVGLTLANASATLLSRTLAFFGGPIGLAITAIVGLLALFASRTRDASDALTVHGQLVTDLEAAYRNAAAGATDWANEIARGSTTQAIANLETFREELQDIRDGLQAPAGGGAMGDMLRGAIEGFQEGTLKAAEFKAVVDYIAQTDPNFNRELALRFLEVADNAEEAEDRVRTAEAVLRIFQGTASDADYALLGLTRAAQGAAPAVAGAGTAAGIAAGQFSDAASAANAYAAALRGIAGIAATPLTDRAAADARLNEGLAALNEMEFADEGERFAEEQRLRAEHEAALTRIVADEANQRGEILRNAAGEAVRNGLEPLDRAIYDVNERYAEQRAELVRLGASQAELNALEQAYQQELTNTNNAYAERESRGGGGGGGGSTDVVAEGIKRLREQTEAIRQQGVALNMTEAEAAAYRAEQELLNAARAEGVALSPAEVESIRAAAAAYGEATAALIAQQEAQRAAEERMNNWKAATKDFFSTFIGGLREGKTAMESLGDALGRLADRLIDMALDMAINALFANLKNIGSGGGGGGTPIISFFKKLFGFAEGGLVTGPGTGTSDSILARLSAGEFVMNAEATRRHFGLLQAMNDNRLPRTAGRVVDLKRPSGGGVSINITQNVDARGSTMSEADFKRILETNNKRLREEIPLAVERHQINRRFG